MMVVKSAAITFEGIICHIEYQPMTDLVCQICLDNGFKPLSTALLKIYSNAEIEWFPRAFAEGKLLQRL
jgi:hypothetical protein